MIKAEEIRVNNLIADEEGTPMYLNYIKPSTQGWRYVDSAGNTGLLKSCNGIPLTEEWLLKFGFICTINNKDSGYKQYGLNIHGLDFMFTIECNCAPEFFLCMVGVDILFVHQLENIYYDLTGKNIFPNKR